MSIITSKVKKNPKTLGDKKRISKNITELILCWPSIARQGMVGIPSETPLGKVVFPLQVVDTWS